MFQTRSGRTALRTQGRWMVQDPDLPTFRMGWQDPVTGKHPAHEDLDIIPVTPTDAERQSLNEIYQAFGLVFADPVDETDQRIIMVLRKCRR